MTYPSFIAMAVSGLILLYVLIMLISNRDQSGLGLTDDAAYRKTVVLLLLSLGIGVHGLAHAYSEINFDFNPLRGQWKYEENE